MAKKLNLTPEEQNILFKMVEKKVSGIAWVLENKNPEEIEDSDGLKQYQEKLNDILKKLRDIEDENLL